MCVCNNVSHLIDFSVATVFYLLLAASGLGNDDLTPWMEAKHFRKIQPLSLCSQMIFYKRPKSFLQGHLLCSDFCHPLNGVSCLSRFLGNVFICCCFLINIKENPDSLEVVFQTCRGKGSSQLSQSSSAPHSVRVTPS